VINALSTNQKNVPYRSNELTRVMKDSLGGTAKTLMFVNCSPSVYNTAETKNSLRYAESAKKITNKVAKAVETKEISKLKSTIDMLEGQMEKMEDLLNDSEQADAWKGLKEAFVEEYNHV